MPYAPEIIIALLLALFLFIYLVNALPAYKRAKKQLLAKYHRLRVKSLRLQEELHYYILKNDVLKEEMDGTGVTYGAYLKKIQKNHALHLSEKGYIKLRKSNNRLLMHKAKRTLELQDTELKNIELTLSNAKKKAPQHGAFNEFIIDKLV